MIPLMKLESLFIFFVFSFCHILENNIAPLNELRNEYENLITYYNIKIRERNNLLNKLEENRYRISVIYRDYHQLVWMQGNNIYEQLDDLRIIIVRLNNSYNLILGEVLQLEVICVGIYHEIVRLSERIYRQ